MRLWRDSYMKPAIVVLSGSAIVSLGVHAVLVAAAVFGTRPAAEMPSEGLANHAGATLPEDRYDALIPIAELTLMAQRVMRSRPGLVATVGEACVVGGASNVIPGRARCSLDVRSLDPDVLQVGVADSLDAPPLGRGQQLRAQHDGGEAHGAGGRGAGSHDRS